eukprot:scaffold289673_cov33-Tisochrysis_lutea.AAC.3
MAWAVPMCLCACDGMMLARRKTTTSSSLRVETTSRAPSTIVAACVPTGDWREHDVGAVGCIAGLGTSVLSCQP